MSSNPTKPYEPKTIMDPEMPKDHPKPSSYSVRLGHDGPDTVITHLGKERAVAVFQQHYGIIRSSHTPEVRRGNAKPIVKTAPKKTDEDLE